MTHQNDLAKAIQHHEKTIEALVNARELLMNDLQNHPMVVTKTIRKDQPYKIQDVRDEVGKTVSIIKKPEGFNIVVMVVCPDHETYDVVKDIVDTW